MKDLTKSLKWSNVVIGLLLAALLFIVINPTGATTRLSGTSSDDAPWAFTLTDATDSDPFPMKGLYVCKLDDAGGGAWGGGTVTLQKLLFGTLSGGTYVNVETAVLVGATSDIAWTQFTAGVGWYKWSVTGGSSMSVTAHCGKAY